MLVKLYWSSLITVNDVLVKHFFVRTFEIKKMQYLRKDTLW